MSEDSKPSENSTQRRNAWFAELAAAGGIAVLGLLLGAGIFGIPPGVGYDRIGPRFFPSLVAAGLVLLGTWLAVAGLRSATIANTSSGTEFPTNWRALGFLAAALLLSLALFERGGFVVSSSALFWVVARGFGSRKPLRDAVIAVALGVAVFLAFTHGLGLTLPAGVWGLL